MGKTAVVKVEIDGQSFPLFTQVVISQSIFGHHRIELRVPIEERENLLHDWTEKHVGKEILVHLGAKKDDTEPLFKGLLTKLELSRYHGSSNEAIFYGVSATAYFDLGVRFHSFEEMSIGRIAQDAFDFVGYSNFEFKKNVRDDVKPPYYVQYGETAFRFLQRLADDFGEYFYYDGLKFVFGKPSDSPSLELRLGSDLASLDLSMQVQPIEFTMKGYDYRENKTFESASSAQTVSGLDEYAKLAAQKSVELYKSKSIIETSQLIKGKADLDKFTLREKGKQSADLVHFSGKCDNPKMRLGGYVKILAVVERTSDQTGGKEISYGEFFVTKTVHRADNSGNYSCHFEAIPSKIEFPPHNPGVVYPQSETQVATIEENHDPRGLGRVRVRFNWMVAPQRSPWMRVTSAAGGKGHGFYFVPEKGDEILVGFEHNNPVKPFGLGAVVTGNSKPGGDVQNIENEIKNILTKSGISLKMNGTTLSFETGNAKITLTPGTIVLNVTGTIDITASDALTIKGKTVTIEATGGALTASGSTTASIAAKGGALTATGSTDATLEAKGGAATVKGSATAEVSAPAATLKGTTTAEVTSANTTINGTATTTVKGGMVKLN
jgi:type VI secretion system secreted protein VgrG